MVPCWKSGSLGVLPLSTMVSMCVCTSVDWSEYKETVHCLHLIYLNLLPAHNSFQLHYFLAVCFNFLTITMEEVDYSQVKCVHCSFFSIGAALWVPCYVQMNCNLEPELLCDEEDRKKSPYKHHIHTHLPSCGALYLNHIESNVHSAFISSTARAMTFHKQS